MNTLFLSPETEARYRFYTEAKHGPIPDWEWEIMLNNYRLKITAHRMVARGLKNGTIVRRNCQIENCKNYLRERTDGHHPDYGHPTLVVWLCRHHHVQEHKFLKSASPEDRQERTRLALGLAARNLLDHLPFPLNFTTTITADPEVDWGRPEDYQDTIIDRDQHWDF